MTTYIPPKEVLEMAVKSLMDIYEKYDRWQKTFDEMFDGRFVPTYFDDTINNIIKIVEILFKDTDGKYGSHFSWWCFEANFGRNELADSVTDSNTQEKIPMKTVDDLYNYYLKYHFKEGL